jgi:uncharacterized protein YfkK (UPF0435 family)
MAGMSIQDRYDEICKLSGLSEEVVRRVFKATKQSIANSLRQGESSTVPGIVTITPEVRQKLNIGGQSVTRYIKLKAKASSAIESEIANIDSFIQSKAELSKEEYEAEMQSKLFLKDPILNAPEEAQGVRVSQINALL